MKFAARDKRDSGFFQIDNEVLDNYDLSPLAFVLYSWLVRYAGPRTGSFFSVRTFAKKYKKGKTSIREARQELLDSGLIIEAGKDPHSGVIYFELPPVPKTTRVHTGPTPGPVETNPGSEVDPPPGPAQTPKNTNIKIQEYVHIQGAPSEEILSSLTNIYATEYFGATGRLYVHGVLEREHLRKLMIDCNLPRERVEQDFRALGKKWKSKEARFWPSTMLKYDPVLISRLDRDAAAEQNDDYEYMKSEFAKMGKDYDEYLARKQSA